MDEFFSNSKYNESVTLTKEDQNNNVKIFCQEPYAQELYDILTTNFKGIGGTPIKDLEIGQILEVRAKSINFNDKVIVAEDIKSSTQIIIPFREFSKDPAILVDGEYLEFNALVLRDDKGQFVGSEKKTLSIVHRRDLASADIDKFVFDVHIIKLINGGFLAKYKDSVECFIPGGLAAANVIHDFHSYVGKTIPVMIENYDSANDLFIVSFKKYVKYKMSERIGELEFGKAYTGVLTNKPYDFGTFVELDGFFTGLIHSSEFENYNEFKKTKKAGDTVEFYIKDIKQKKGEYRIFLTLDPENINEERKHWTKMKDLEGEAFMYDYDKHTKKVSFFHKDTDYELQVRGKSLSKVNKKSLVMIERVDPVNRRVKFDFVEESDI